jgi:hypothetical protein
MSKSQSLKSTTLIYLTSQINIIVLDYLF